MKKQGTSTIYNYLLTLSYVFIIPRHPGDPSYYGAKDLKTTASYKEFTTNMRKDATIRQNKENGPGKEEKGILPLFPMVPTWLNPPVMSPTQDCKFF